MRVPGEPTRISNLDSMQRAIQGVITVQAMGTWQRRVPNRRRNLDVELLTKSGTLPLLIGQPLTELPHITVVKRRDIKRLFEENLEDKNNIQSMLVPDLPEKKVTLWAREASVILCNYIGFISLHMDGSVNKERDLFIDLQLRGYPARNTASPEVSSESMIKVTHSYQL